MLRPPLTTVGVPSAAWSATQRIVSPGVGCGLEGALQIKLHDALTVGAGCVLVVHESEAWQVWSRVGDRIRRCGVGIDGLGLMVDVVVVER